MDADNPKIKGDKLTRPLLVLKVKCIEDCFFEILVAEIVKNNTAPLTLHPGANNLYYLDKQLNYQLDFNASLYNVTSTALGTKDYILTAKHFYGNAEIFYNNKYFDSNGKLDNSNYTDYFFMNSKRNIFQTRFLNTSEISFNITTHQQKAGFFLNIFQDAKYHLIKKGYNIFNIFKNSTSFQGFIHLNEYYKSVMLSAKVKNMEGKITMYARYVVLDKNNKTKFYEYPNSERFHIKREFDNLKTVS